ncbi:MAG: DUF1540 domain-containing protein [Bacillota bacterium]|nr:DUF1540 domain-containing protein [Bacillota bacterium]
MDSNKKQDCLDGIICDAEKCEYNDSRKCYASSIKVEHGNATTSSETECSTFKNNTSNQ